MQQCTWLLSHWISKKLDKSVIENNNMYILRIIMITINLKIQS